MENGEFITADIQEYCMERFSVRVSESSCKSNFISIYPDDSTMGFDSDFFEALAYIEKETGCRVRTFSYNITSFGSIGAHAIFDGCEED